MYKNKNKSFFIGSRGAPSVRHRGEGYIYTLASIFLFIFIRFGVCVCVRPHSHSLSALSWHWLLNVVWPYLSSCVCVLLNLGVFSEEKKINYGVRTRESPEEYQ